MHPDPPDRFITRLPRNVSLVSVDSDTQSLVKESKFPLWDGMSGWLKRLRVGQKIFLGYVVVLGVVMLGTAAGFMTADYYQKEAHEKEEDAIEELYHVYRLKAAVFRVRTKQHKLILYMEQPALWRQKYPQLVEYVADARQAWGEFREIFSNPQRRSKDTTPEKVAFERLMRTYKNFDNYLGQSEKLFQSSNPQNLTPESINATQAKLFNFMHNSQVFTLDDFLNEVTHLVEVTAAEYNQAKTDLRNVEKLRLQIIAVSLVLSVVIATLLAGYMNWAIVRPIQAVTYVAQQAIEESNFDLQAPVVTHDEIGILATSLNRLIQEVQQLLKTQADTNEQLEVYSQVLEKKVREYNQELRRKEQSLQKTLEELHQIQAQLAAFEKE